MVYNKPVIEIGSPRWVLKFAWTPKKTPMGTTIWLERYVSEEVYSEWKVPGPGYKGTRVVKGWIQTACFVWSGTGVRINKNL